MIQIVWTKYYELLDVIGLENTNNILVTQV